MRIAGLILGVLGGIAAAMLGITWLSDYNEYKDTIDAALELSAAAGSDLPAEFAEIKRLALAAYFLLGAGAIGLVGGIMTFLGRGKIAGPMMIVAALIPTFFAPEAMVFTSILLIAGVISFLAKPKVITPVPSAPSL